ncbi:MAG: hypothetical protein AB1847_16625 [bacterium]
MTDQQKKEFFLFLQKFCSDNAGNRLNEWIIEAFLNRAAQKLNSIVADNQTQKAPVAEAQMAEVIGCQRGCRPHDALAKGREKCEQD